MKKLRFTITTEIEVELDMYPHCNTLEEAAKQQQNEWNNKQLPIEDIIKASSRFNVRIEAVKEKI